MNDIDYTSFSAGSMANGTLRECRGSFPASCSYVQSLLATLPGAKLGTGERCILWQASAFCVRGTENSASWNKVKTSILLFEKKIADLCFFLKERQRLYA